MDRTLGGVGLLILKEGSQLKPLEKIWVRRGPLVLLGQRGGTTKGDLGPKRFVFPKVFPLQFGAWELSNGKRGGIPPMSFNRGGKHSILPTVPPWRVSMC